MMCYMDMTFCKHAVDCAKATNCFRALTPEVQRKADEWWGQGPNKAPIAVFVDKPQCWEQLNG